MLFSSGSELHPGQFQSVTGALRNAGVRDELVALGEWRTGIQAGHGRDTDSIVRAVGLTVTRNMRVVFAALLE